MGIMDTLKGALQGLGALQSGLQGIRTQLAAARREREDIECAATCRADVKSIVGDWIDSCSKQYEERFLRQLGLMLRKPKAYRDPTHPCSRNLSVLSIARDTNNAADAHAVDVALMALLGPQLKPAVFKVIDALEWPSAEGLPLVERERRLAELDKKIKRLEAEEAELVQLAASHRILLD